MEVIDYEDEIIKYRFTKGILHFIYKVEKVDLQVAKHVFNVKFNKFSESEEYPCFIDYSRVVETTKEARDIFASAEGRRNCKAMAVLTNLMLGKIMFNFYIKISKPEIPTKLFKNEKEAMKWLEQFI